MYNWTAYVLVIAFVGTSVAIGNVCLKVIHALPLQYYYSLPVSTAHDLDRDGIADNYDDSDGDGIADQIDATPYNEAAKLVRFQKLFNAMHK